jgi:hypothetical protein
VNPTMKVKALLTLTALVAFLAPLAAFGHFGGR